MNENEQRNYPDSKVYHDGSHFIAIPQGSYPSGKGCKRRHTAILRPNSQPVRNGLKRRIRKVKNTV